MGKMPGAHTEMTDGPSCKHCMRPWPLTRRSGLSPLANTLKAILHGTSVPIPELSSLESMTCFVDPGLMNTDQLPESTSAPGLVSQKKIAAGSCSHEPESSSRRHAAHRPVHR